MKYIKWFDEITMNDLSLVGGKNASLGEMISQLSNKGIRIPHGFAITAQAYWYYIKHNHLIDKMKEAMSDVTDVISVKELEHVGQCIRTLIEHGSVPNDLAEEICHAYKALSVSYYIKECDIAVRSSATAEDLPTASFAGQHDSFLNVKGKKELLIFYKKCLASLFNDRAIMYRNDQKFDHFKVALSVGVQKMIRSDKAVSGVAFSLDTETGFKDVVTIESSYGLGEAIVQGLVTPDEFIIYKPTLNKGFASIIQKKCGDKKDKIIYAVGKRGLTKTVRVPKKDQHILSLQDDEIIELSRFVIMIEQHYSDKKGQWVPMDVEWAKNDDGLLYIIQARPETVSAGKKVSQLSTYTLKNTKELKIIVQGLSIGQKIVSGVARLIRNVKDIATVQPGDIIVTEMTDPDWVPVMKKATGIITNQGGRTCHAAIVSRELGLPAIVGTQNATHVIKDGITITLDCSQGAKGYIYTGIIPFQENIIALDTIIPKTSPAVMINTADPATAFRSAFLPVAGVGLARIEFIITTMIQVHPLALLYPEKIKDRTIVKKIDKITMGYRHKNDFFISLLSQGIGMIAAAFYPRPVIVRFSDFKTNEYRNLIGGKYFEPIEENPMIGFRGASRYYHPQYQKAFALECAAIQQVRNVMGLCNVKVMVPFVRTVKEAENVINEMNNNGLVRGKDNLEIVMMCEVPSNVVLIEQFSQFFDGFSIGSNDLTQLVLGVDRDSRIISPLFDERDEAVKKMMAMAIDGAHAQKRYIGICGQAPSDYPEIADFLMKRHIDSLSLNIDSVISFLLH
jgi:pyruvate,water dikinase